jgi:hypothetical protein
MGKLIISLKDYLRYLRLKGLQGYGRKKGSHERWDYPPGAKRLSRPVTVDHAHHEVPEWHIRTNARTLGLDIESTRREMIEMGILKAKGK